MKIRILVLLLLCLGSLSVSARQVVTGVIADKETTQPVQDFTVELVRLPDSSLVETVTSSSEGIFLFYKADTANTYALRLKHNLYKTLVAPVPVKKSGLVNSLGILKVEPTFFNLKEVVVQGYKVTVTERNDRTVYGIPEGLQKTSSDGLDVLRKVPTVQVDYLNEDITVNGRSNIKIEVDGISRDKGYLKRLHPSQISKMEIITQPSGKYDADIDAVINVVTNPAMRYGLKGMVYAAAFPIARDSYLGLANASLDYGREKISYYVAGNGIYQNMSMDSKMNRQTANSSIYQQSTQPIQATLANFNVGFIYDPDEFNDINFNVAYNNTSIQVGNNSVNDARMQGIRSLYRSESETNSNDGGLTSSLFYKHFFDKEHKQTFEAEVNYYNSLGNTSRTDFTNSYLDTLTNSPYYTTPNQWERSKTTVRNLYGQANYSLPFDSLYVFNAGLSGNFNRYLLDNSSQTISGITPNNLDYADLRLGGFAEVSRSLKKGNLRLGSRFETSRVSVGSGSPHFYRSFLPYANALYTINSDNSLKLGYSRRVIRPSTSQLNPLVSVVDSLTISQGNPDLKPAYRDNIQLTYTLRLPFKKSTINLSPQVYYEYKSGLIQTIVRENTQTGRFESLPANISNGYEYGGNLSINAQVGPVMVNSNVRYSLFHVNKYLNQIDATDRRGWSWNGFVMCPLPANMHLITLINWNGPMLNGQTETRMDLMHLIGLGKQFKNNSVLRLMAYNPFSKDFMHQQSNINTAALTQTQHMYLHKDMGIMLMYVYSFKVGETIERERKTVEQQTTDKLINLPINF